MNFFYEIIQHGLTDISESRKRVGTFNLSDIVIAEQVGGVRREAAFDCGPGTERGKNNLHIFNMAKIILVYRI